MAQSSNQSGAEWAGGDEGHSSRSSGHLFKKPGG